MNKHTILKAKMLSWANQFNIFCLLDNNGYSFEPPAFECMLAVGCERQFVFNRDNNFDAFKTFYEQQPSWLFGHLGYNAVGNAYEKSNLNTTDFADGFFFEPQIIVGLNDEKLTVLKSNIDIEIIFEQINAVVLNDVITKAAVHFTPTITKDIYLQKIKLLQAHIQKGDCYEINFCQQFTAINVAINVVETYKKLTALSPAPFAAFYKIENNYCLCASPERYMQKKGDVLLSQPIKGTSKRNHSNAIIDEANKNHLLKSEKEKSENVMVVDLVRNDMSMVCQKGSVQVKELFGIYSFPQVHQMISSIEGKLSAHVHFIDAIKACYPMGSMTGAPKKKVMQLIAQTETMQRGLFSGSIGYITPSADVDFNVVIRSVFYNQQTNQANIFAGSGITFNSDAAQEYEECLMKMEVLEKVIVSE